MIGQTGGTRSNASTKEKKLSVLGDVSRLAGGRGEA